MKKAVFPGSFDPFTNGHLDMVKKAAALFDRVYVMIGVNSEKKRYIPAELIKTATEKCLSNNGLTNCEVVEYTGLLVDFAKEHNANYVVRGLRSSTDYEYEEAMAGINTMLLPGLEYVYFRSENSAVSSSLVRELLAFNQSAEQFLPPEIQEITQRITK